MFDFDVPDWVHGTSCSICGDSISLDQYRRLELCKDCEFDKLTPPAWMELLLAAMEHWKDNGTVV